MEEWRRMDENRGGRVPNPRYARPAKCVALSEERTRPSSLALPPPPSPSPSPSPSPLLHCCSKVARHVAHRGRGIPAHSSCAQHERGWTAEDHVRADLHQGSGAPLRQLGVQEGRRRYEQEGRRAVGGRAGELDGDCGEPAAVQDTGLVPEQEEGPQGRALLAGGVQRPRHEAQGRPRAPQEDQEPPWSASLLGPACAWTAHQDNRTARKNRRCFQEAIESLVSVHLKGFMVSPFWK